MAPLDGSRPGGRSARIQRSVHEAVRHLEATRGRDALTVPLVAEAAGVAVTTVYRRWGDLDALLADVAAERFRDAPPPEETGSLLGDLRAWAVQFLEENRSGPGREHLLDLVRGDVSGSTAMACTDRARSAISEIAARHGAERAIDVERVVDRVMAPVVFRIVFTDEAVHPEYAASLVEELRPRLEAAIAP